jgi:hypothetical protein
MDATVLNSELQQMLVGASEKLSQYIFDGQIRPNQDVVNCSCQRSRSLVGCTCGLSDLYVATIEHQVNNNGDSLSVLFHAFGHVVDMIRSGKVTHAGFCNMPMDPVNCNCGVSNALYTCQCISEFLSGGENQQQQFQFEDEIFNAMRAAIIRLAPMHFTVDDLNAMTRNAYCAAIETIREIED